MIAPYRNRIEKQPAKPNSSARVANMKSVRFSGRKSSWLWLPRP